MFYNNAWWRRVWWGMFFAGSVLGYAADNRGEIATNERADIASAFRSGEIQVARSRVDAASAARPSREAAAVGRMAILSDVSVMLYGKEGRGLVDCVAEMRRGATAASADKSTMSQVWTRVGDVEAKLLGDTTAARGSYMKAIEFNEKNESALKGIERLDLLAEAWQGLTPSAQADREWFSFA